MRAVVYARYSSNKQRESSIEDQFRNYDQFADREGWDIVSRYSDEALSGCPFYLLAPRRSKWNRLSF